MKKCNHTHWEPSFKQIGQTIIPCAYCLNCKKHVDFGKGSVTVISPKSKRAEGIRK